MANKSKKSQFPGSLKKGSAPKKTAPKRKHLSNPEIPEMSEKQKKIVAFLGNRIGRKNAIKMPDLAAIVQMKERQLRIAINDLKFNHRIPILSWDHPRFGGYYLAAEKADQAECLQMFMARIWTSLKNVATINGISLIEAGELFTLELTKKSEEKQKTEFMRGLPKPPRGYSLITSLLKHIQKEPEKYAKDLHQLQNAFGAKFIERKKLKELAEIREQLNGICSDLEG